MGTLNSWSITDANNNAPPPDGWPENTMNYADVNNTGRAVQGTIKRFFSDNNGTLVAGGAVNAYTLTLNETGYTVYFNGMRFACSIPVTNTVQAPTMNVNAIGPATIVSASGVPIKPGALVAGGIYTFQHDGTNLRVVGAAPASSPTEGQVIGGQGSVTDVTIKNSAGNVAARVPTGTQNLDVVGRAQQGGADLIGLIYPIGSIYLSTAPTNPGTLFGVGTWVRIAQGRTLIGEGTGAGLKARAAGATLGAEDAIVPAHSHTINDPGHTHSHNRPATYADPTGNTGPNNTAGISGSGTTGSSTTGITVNSAGVSAVDGNMQPSLVVYIWERTA